VSIIAWGRFIFPTRHAGGIRRKPKKTLRRPAHKEKDHFEEPFVSAAAVNVRCFLQLMRYPFFNPACETYQKNFLIPCNGAMITKGIFWEVLP
jgi:hypothetical protein